MCPLFPCAILLLLALVACAPTTDQEGDKPRKTQQTGDTSRRLSRRELALEPPFFVYALSPSGSIRRVSPLHIEGERTVFSYPSIHPDGTDAVYMGGVNWPPRIWRTDLRTGETIPITPTDLAAFFPAYSADGKKIVFNARTVKPEHLDPPRPWHKLWRSEASQGFSHIFIMNRDGTDLTQLTWGSDLQDWRPCLSPDARTAVFVSRRPQQGLWSVPVNERAEPRLLVENGLRPVFHPDGSRIFFHRHTPDGQRISSIPADGGEVVQLAGDDRGDSYGPFVDYDGKSLFMHSNRATLKDPGRKTVRIWEVPFGSSPRLLPIPGFENVFAGHASRARDGTIVFDSKHSLPDP